MLLPVRPAVSRRVVPRGSHVVFTDSRRHEPTRLRLEPICPESGRLRPESAVSAETANSGQNSKKKKKVQNAPFDLILTLLQPNFTQNAKTPLLTFRLTSLSSLCLCALCLSASISSPLLHQFILSSALSHAFLTQVCFQS